MRLISTNDMFTLTDPIPVLLPTLVWVPIGIYSNTIGIGHFIWIGIGQCERTVRGTPFSLVPGPFLCNGVFTLTDPIAILLTILSLSASESVSVNASCVKTVDLGNIAHVW